MNLETSQDWNSVKAHVKSAWHGIKN